MPALEIRRRSRQEVSSYDYSSPEGDSYYLFFFHFFRPFKSPTSYTAESRWFLHSNSKPFQNPNGTGFATIALLTNKCLQKKNTIRRLIIKILHAFFYVLHVSCRPAFCLHNILCWTCGSTCFVCNAIHKKLIQAVERPFTFTSSKHYLISTLQFRM